MDPRTPPAQHAQQARDARRRAWVLNLDADVELGAPPGTRYQPTARVLSAMRPHVERLAGMLLGPDDLLVDDETPPLAAQGLEGRAFCPTPRALAVLRRAGATSTPTPDVAVLRRVNGRAFAASLGETLPDAAFVTTLQALDARLARAPEPPVVGARWRVKRAWGMAGRGQRVLSPGAPDARSSGDREFLRAGLAEGGLQVEPDVAIEVEYAQHGVLEADGALRVGSLVRQRCDPRGAWLSTERIEPEQHGELGDVPARLADEVRHVARALHEAGYFGPFGVDAFTWRDLAGAIRLQPRSEINARYSMGFAVGFGRD
jgi:hypothetical protein